MSVTAGNVYLKESEASVAGSTEYVKAISEVLGHGDATEHSYRPALKSWIESFGENISATNEPKRAEHNAPDFDVKVLRGHAGPGLLTRRVFLYDD